MRRPLLALAFLGLPALAHADDAIDASASTAPPITVGARVGGYGFRDPQAGDRRDAWDDCRMNGLGVFARKDLGRVNVEAGTDIYFSESFPMKPSAQDAGEDRLSGLVTVAAGARLVDTKYVRALAQIGTGVELTRFSMAMPNGTTAEDSRALPLGFVGVAGEVVLGARTAIGASMRTYIMGKFEADRDCQLEVKPEAAAQGQFYLTYRL